MDGTWTPERVAQRLNTSVDFVYRNKSAIGYFQVGRLIRFTPEDVDRYLAKCRRGPQQEGQQWATQSGKGKTAKTRGLSRSRMTEDDLNALFDQKKTRASMQ